MSELRDIRTIIIDEKGHASSLIRSLLVRLGVQRIAALHSTDDALKLMREETFDVVFCDEYSAPLNPVAFVKAVRRDLTTRDVTIPVVLISAGASRKQIELARDAGLNDIIAKPVSVDTIERKLRQLTCEPQAFVTAKTFLGPDRRRSDERRGEQRHDGSERRGTKNDGNVFRRPPRIKPDQPAKN